MASWRRSPRGRSGLEQPRDRGPHKGQTAKANRLGIEALHIYTDRGFDEGQLDCLEVIAAVAAAAGDHTGALRILLVTTRAREELGSPLFVPDELAQVSDALAIARGGLDPIEVARITLEARDLTLSATALLVQAG